MRECGAKTRGGGTCKQPGVGAGGRCRYHGGATPSGIASPQFRHGRYSAYLPARLLERYEQAQGDGELLALREEVALTDARLADLLKRVDTGESGSLWTNLRAEVRAMQQARADGDTDAMRVALANVERLVLRGQADYAAWGEVYGVLEQRRKLVESERKRLVEMQQMITAERAGALVLALLDSVKRNVTDRSALDAIQRDFLRLTAGDGPQVIDADA